MGSRLKDNPDSLFEVYVQISKSQDADPAIVQQFPLDYADTGMLVEIPKLAFPCETDGSHLEYFSFVVPDQTGMLRMGYCRLAAGHQTCLCVLTWLPWFEVFYHLLDFVARIADPAHPDKVMTFLSEVHGMDIPAAKMPVTVVAGDEMFNFTVPDPTILPSIPKSRNLTEYYNALDTQNMMLVFASMLQERRIYMSSKKLTRLTSCIFAAEALLYPMHWQHTFIPVLPGNIIECLGLMTPYIIGVHKNLISKLSDLEEDLEDAVFVDLDNNTVVSIHDDLGRLPNSLVRILKSDLRLEKVKASVQKSGDVISFAFLMALVRLIGGYREAFAKQPESPVMFDERAFIQTRKSKSYQSFLQGMLSLQCFNEFIHGKTEQLKAGTPGSDLFEQQASIYAQRHRKRSQRNFKSMKNKIKASGKKAFTSVISGLTDTEDKKKSHAKSPVENLRRKVNIGRPLSLNVGPTYKSTLSLIVDTSVDVPKPDETLPIRRHDSVEEALSYRELDMDLLGDSDIQAVMDKSPSAEMLHRKFSIGSGSSSSSESGDEETDVSTSSVTGSVNSLTLGQETKAVQDKIILPTPAPDGDKLILPMSRPRSKRLSTKINIKPGSLSGLLFRGRKFHKPDLTPLHPNSSDNPVFSVLAPKDDSNIIKDDSSILKDDSSILKDDSSILKDDSSILKDNGTVSTAIDGNSLTQPQMKDGDIGQREATDKAKALSDNLLILIEPPTESGDVDLVDVTDGSDTGEKRPQLRGAVADLLAMDGESEPTIWEASSFIAEPSTEEKNAQTGGATVDLLISTENANINMWENGGGLIGQDTSNAQGSAERDELGTTLLPTVASVSNATLQSPTTAATATKTYLDDLMDLEAPTVPNTQASTDVSSTTPATPMTTSSSQGDQVRNVASNWTSSSHLYSQHHHSSMPPTQRPYFSAQSTHRMPTMQTPISRLVIPQVFTNSPRQPGMSQPQSCALVSPGPPFPTKPPNPSPVLGSGQANRFPSLGRSSNTRFSPRLNGANVAPSNATTIPDLDPFADLLGLSFGGGNKTQGRGKAQK